MQFEDLREKASRALFVENMALTDLLNLNRLANREARQALAPVIFETYLHGYVMKGILDAIDRTKEALSEPLNELSPEKLEEALEAQEQAELEAIELYSKECRELGESFLKDIFCAIAKDEESHHKLVTQMK